MTLGRVFWLTGFDGRDLRSVGNCFHESDFEQACEQRDSAHYVALAGAVAGLRLPIQLSRTGFEPGNPVALV